MLAQQHSETSVAAAEEIAASAATLRGLVLSYIQIRGEEGATDEEIAAALDMNPSTARPRRVELERAGLIKKSGRRPTRSGRMATVWSA